MHEASIALSLVRLVEEVLVREGGQRALSASVAVGSLSHVDPDALLFSWESACRGGPAAGARLEIERPPGKATCMGCGAEVALAARGDGCPTCGSFRLLVTDGDQLRLTSVEIA